MKQKELDAVDDPILGVHEGANIRESHAAEIPSGTDLNDWVETLCGQTAKAKWLDELRDRGKVTCGNCRRVLRSRE